MNAVNTPLPVERRALTLTLDLRELESLVEELVDRRLAERLGESRSWITLEEAAKRLCLTTTAARKRAQRGQLPGAIRDGARWLVDARSLAVWVGQE